MKRLKLSDVRAELRPLGVTVTRRAATNEYRVNIAGGTEDTAYYTEHLDDARGTGMAMADDRRRAFSEWRDRRVTV